MKLHYTLHSPTHSETVLLLHGMGSSGDDWVLQLPALAPRYRVLTLDARGHGQSAKPPGPYSIPQMADDVIELLDDLKIEAAHVVGLSMGGCIGLQMAIAHPSRVRSFVCVNSFAKIRPAGLNGFARFLRRVWALNFGKMEDVAEPVARAMFPKPEQDEIRRLTVQRIASNPKGPYRATLRACLNFNALPRLHRVKCPTLIVAGDRDLTVSLAVKKEMHRGLPHAELVIIPDSGHATPIDQSEKFNEILLGFLSGQRI
ncbi:MAG: alpha/beta fold hydrolase [Chloroflexi bacterium]|nr:alpha/beta fold hydrolase [Chloroflexota bacterium]